MALVLADRVREGTNTAGTGTVTLTGAVTGFASFADQIGNGNTTYYTITDGTNWEVGVGTYNTNTLSRDTVLDSNTGSKINFAAGFKDVFVTLPGSKAVSTDTLGTIATQNANAIAITGGNINGTTIGGTTPAAGTFTTLTATGQTSLGGAAGSEGFRVYVPSTTGTWLSARSTSSSVFLGEEGTSLPFVVNTNSNIFSVRTGTLGAVSLEQLRVAHTASAVNYVQVIGAATTIAPAISAQGSDTNVNLNVLSKGTGYIGFTTNATSNQVRILHTANANYITLTGSASGSGVVFGAGGTDTNIDLTLTPKGTGNVRFGTYTASMALTVQGYIEIKDSGGTVRKLAVIA
jgi:hypothetical protein